MPVQTKIRVELVPGYIITMLISTELYSNLKKSRKIYRLTFIRTIKALIGNFQKI